VRSIELKDHKNCTIKIEAKRLKDFNNCSLPNFELLNQEFRADEKPKIAKQKFLKEKLSKAFSSKYFIDEKVCNLKAYRYEQPQNVMG
jgi:hypothetical protein